MTFTRRTSRLAAGLGIAAAGVLLLAGPAAADTSQATANAAHVTLGSSSVLNTGQVAASNDGTGQVKTGSQTTSVLGTQTLLTAGVLAQDAVARNNGTSAACAGAVGSGGIIQVGAAGGCTTTIGTPAGVTVNLSPGLATLGADAVFAQCAASSTGAPTGSATIVNGNIFLLGAPLPIVLQANPAANGATINVPGIASVKLNEQITNANGSLTVNALHVTLLPNALGSSLADIVIGSVTCGPNAVAPGTPLFAGPALPAALAGAALVGGVAFTRRRRRLAA